MSLASASANYCRFAAFKRRKLWGSNISPSARFGVLIGQFSVRIFPEDAHLGWRECITGKNNKASCKLFGLGFHSQAGAQGLWWCWRKARSAAYWETCSWPLGHVDGTSSPAGNEYRCQRWRESRQGSLMWWSVDDVNLLALWFHPVAGCWSPWNSEEPVEILDVLSRGIYSFPNPLDAGAGAEVSKIARTGDARETRIFLPHLHG